METTQSLSSSNQKFRVSIVTTSGASGGHYATYNALRSVIKQQQLPWELNVVDVESFAERLTEQKKIFDIFKLFGTSAGEFVNQAQQKNWKILQKLTNPLIKLLVKLNYGVAVSLTGELWRNQQPDLVVSVLPLYNKIIWESLQRVKPGTPVATILTDFADSPPAFWIEPKTGMYVMCATEKAKEQARHLGVQENLIIKTSGMIIHPRFYEPITCDRNAERERLSLDPDCLTGLVLFGGCGSNQMLEIAQCLECFGQKLQLIFLCGRNQEVALALRESQGLQKRFITTFTTEIPYYMHLADFFIGKPGPGSLSEALAMKLPVIVEHNFGTLPQEQYNAEWLREKQVGLVIPNFRHIQKAVEQFLEPENFARYRANVSAINNRAVFEIPEILQQILATRNNETVARSLVQGKN
jgi:1,2-diacylglycerol 3-beta-galactosyltransferase